MRDKADVVIIYNDYEEPNVMKALEHKFGEIHEITDYFMVIPYLMKMGFDPDIVNKYSIRPNSWIYRQAEYWLDKIGVIRDGKLSRVGRVLADHLVSAPLLAGLLLSSKIFGEWPYNDEKRVVSLLQTLVAGYINSGGYKLEQGLSDKREDPSTFLSVVEGENRVGELNTYLGLNRLENVMQELGFVKTMTRSGFVRWVSGGSFSEMIYDILGLARADIPDKLHPGILFLVGLTHPDLIGGVDYVWEVLMRTSLVLGDLGRVSDVGSYLYVDGSLSPYFDVWGRVFSSLRMVRNRLGGSHVYRFLLTVFESFDGLVELYNRGVYFDGRHLLGGYVDLVARRGDSSLFPRFVGFHVGWSGGRKRRRGRVVNVG